MKKLLSLILALSLLVTSVFVGGISVSANLDSLYTTTNDYDNLPEGIEFSDVEYSGTPSTNVLINGSPQMEDASNIRYFSVWGAQVQSLPESLGNGRALHFTGCGPLDRTHNWQTLARVYQSDSDTLAHFKPEAGKTYEVKLKYFVAQTPNKEIQIQLRNALYSQCSYQPDNGKDGVWMEPPVIASITTATSKWVEATAYFTAPEKTHYINLCLSSATSSSASNIDVWVDDVTISECVKLTAYNYTPETDQSLPVSKFTTIGDLKPESIPGYRFGGVFADEELTQRIPAENKAGNYSNVYFSWLPITTDQGYCGFEDYVQPILASSYNSLVSEISEDQAFVGKYSMKSTLGSKGIAAFEIKNANTFNLVGGKTYTISFVYKSDKDIELYAGVGTLGNIPESAKALNGTNADATTDWKEVTLTVAPENGTNENFALAMLIYAENGATVFVDDILVSGFEQGYVNPALNTGFTSDWFPTLALFEGVEMPKIWGGQNDLSEPKDSDNDGVFEITNGAELAYAIKNGGAADAKYILTKDIYLNNVSAINWKTGEVMVEGYVPNTWFNQAVSFQGSIDGDGHVIYGLYRKDNPSSMISYSGYGTALVPKVPDNGTVSFTNLAVDYAFINVECGAAAFVGTTKSTSQGATSITVDGCYVGENVQLNGGDAGAFVGYSGGSGCALTFNNSYSLATTSGTVNRGLAGVCYQATLLVKNCFNANGPVTSYTNSNWTGKYTIQNTYQTEVNGTDKYYYPTNFETISADDMKGLDVFSEGKMQHLNLSNAYVATEGFPKLAFFEGIELPEIWLGTSDVSAPKDTNDDGILEINNGAELAYAISTGGGAGVKYIITKDIYLNDTSKFDWSTGEIAAEQTVNSWAYYNKPFQGSIDGDGHTIYGLYYKDTSAMSWAVQGAGLIPRVDFGTTCEIKNLAVENSYIYGHAGASAFVGCGGTGNSFAENRAEIIIDRCVVGEKVTVTGTSAGAFRGITRSANTTITNSYSLATVTGGTYGLVAGESWESTVIMTNVFNANGPFGSAAVGTFTNCYQTAAGANTSNVINAVDMKGKDVFNNASKMPNLNADGAFTATDEFPMVSVFNKSDATDTPEEDDGNEENEIVIWGGQNDLSAPLDADGDGIYEIYTPAEFAYIIANYGTMNNVAGCSFILKNDIYLNDITKLNVVNGNGNTLNDWYRYAANDSTGFTGTIDGDGHTVYGLYFNNTNSFGNYAQYGVGLVPAAKAEVTVKNLKVDYSWIRYEGYASVFCGIGRSGATLNITNCIAGANIHHYAYGVGAFRGNSIGMTTNITNSYSLAHLHANGGAYGMVSTINGAVNVSSSYIVGAPVSSTSSTLTSVKSTYESVKSGANNGAILVSENNMKGDDVLTNQNKMPQLAFASAYVPALLDFADHDYYIYLPTGTIIAEDFEPSFLDSFLVNIDASKVMIGNTMTRGAFVSFEKEPQVNKILVPNALEEFIIQGTYEAISSNNLQDKYYGLDTAVVSKKLSQQSDDAINYIFITDIHFMNYDLSWDKNGNVLLEQIRLITDWANRDESIDFVVVGGDCVQGFWDSKEGWKDAITNVFMPFRDCEKPVFVTIGNHDDNAYATWNVNYGEKIISDLDWKNFVLDPISPANIVRPEGDNNAKNYYYDFEKNGKVTRLFFLDAIDYYQEYDENGNITALQIRESLGFTEESAEDYNKYYNGRTHFGYSGEQVKWLADSLAKTDEFDDVMIFSHMGTDASTSTAEFGAEIIDVMAAYNNKTAYNNADLGIDVAYNDNGKILSYQFGHIHKELSVYNAEVDLWQIASSTARADQGSRTLGNSDEACFDAMSVSNSGIQKFGIGASESKSFVSKANIAYGDLNLDNTIDIVDLVALYNTANGDFSKTTAADVNRDNLITFSEDAAALRKAILGD